MSNNIYFKDLPQGSRFIYKGEREGEFTIKRKVFVCPKICCGTFAALIIKQSMVTEPLCDVPVIRIKDD